MWPRAQSVCRWWRRLGNSSQKCFVIFGHSVFLLFCWWFLCLTSGSHEWWPENYRFWLLSMCGFMLLQFSTIRPYPLSSCCHTFEPSHQTHYEASIAPQVLQQDTFNMFHYFLSPKTSQNLELCKAQSPKRRAFLAWLKASTPELRLARCREQRRPSSSWRIWSWAQTFESGNLHQNTSKTK